MKSPLHKNEYIFLTFLKQLPPELTYGGGIWQAWEEEYRSSNLGVIYVTADSLERKGFVTSERRFDEGCKRLRGGRAKRFFFITDAGEEAFLQHEEILRNKPPSVVKRVRDFLHL